MLVPARNIPLLATLFIISVMSVVVYFGGREDSNTSTYILNVLGSKNLLFFVFGMLVSFAEKSVVRKLRIINNSALFYSLSVILILASIMLTDYVSVYGISISILVLMYISTIVEINGDRPINKLMVFLGEASYSLYLVHIFAYIASPYFNIFALNNNLYCPYFHLLQLPQGA
jgi:peptidoglycan/LPS O-acetylase OafA/YrhL